MVKMSPKITALHRLKKISDPDGARSLRVSEDISKKNNGN